MAKEIRRRIDIASLSLVVEVENDFGVVTPHMIPLTGDKCAMCGCVVLGTKGSPDIETSIQAVLSHVDNVTNDVIAKLEPIAHTSPEIKQHLDKAKAKRAAKA